MFEFVWWDVITHKTTNTVCSKKVYFEGAAKSLFKKLNQSGEVSKYYVNDSGKTSPWIMYSLNLNLDGPNSV